MKSLPLVSLMLLIALTSVGCATKGFVRQHVSNEITELHEKTTALETNLEHTQTRVTQNEDGIDQQGQEIENVSGTAREALERAREAGKLAEGKFLYETVFSDDKVRFEFDEADLGGDAQVALDELGQRLRDENKNVYIEIQGHTDGTGPDEYNLKLGENRATAVRDYLGREHQIPLHRMATISYGKTAPVADNNTREGRALNRRVVVVVLQ